MTAPTSRRKPSRPLPDDWEPSPANRRYAEANGIDLDHERGQFVAYHRSKDSRHADWSQAFRTWLGRAPKHIGRPGTIRTADGMAREVTW